jgi:hypothetical protein
MNITDKQNEIIDEFAIFEDWMEKYEYIIDLGKDLPFIEEDKKKQIEILTSKLEEEYKNIIANYKSDRVNRDDNWIYTNQKLLQSIVYLKPNETKNFQIITFWDKQRYFKIDENEYYLDENEKYEFELSLYLDKLNRKEKLTEEEFTKIKNDENFIEGRFSSNKMKINFGE